MSGKNEPWQTDSRTGGRDNIIFSPMIKVYNLFARDGTILYKAYPKSYETPCIFHMINIILQPEANTDILLLGTACFALQGKEYFKVHSHFFTFHSLVGKD